MDEHPLRTALDEPLTVFRTRPPGHVRFLYVYLDATCCKARVNHRIASRAVVVAAGIREDGNHEVLGPMVGDSESEMFWTELLHSLRERGLSGVRLVVTDQLLGLVAAVREVMLGTAWQKCGVHFLSDAFHVIDRDSGELVAAMIRATSTQPTAELMRARLDTVADMLGQRYPPVKAMLLEAKEDLTAFAGFPPRQWTKFRSTNPLELINLEIKRRTDVVQVNLNDGAPLRLVTAVLFEPHHEWITLPRPLPPRRQHGRALPRTP
ncbi:transposase [Streptomyces tauricus]|uniref:IS256 family transposase n=1 Tax=Streptomyces tauricus TaxID=68274 RepID=UPI00224327A3|nr:transposase [Streptomyces tauricus]MCW8103566.1 transposase [Streptomyces tauricus]